MKITLFDMNTIPRLADSLLDIARLDIYYQPLYLLANATMEKSVVEVFVAEEGNDYFIYPYLKKELHGTFLGYYDITSPYGYCGPVCTNDAFFRRAEKMFMKHARENKIVSEFVRYHYVYNKENRFTEKIKNIHNREIILVECGKGWNEVWTKNFNGGARNISRKCEKEGLAFSFVDYKTHAEEFMKMYYETMQYVSADQYYFFKEDYFRDLGKLDDRLKMAVVQKDGSTCGSVLFFLSGKFFTYHLSARSRTASSGATNFMLSEAIRYACENGFEYCNLGGGSTVAENDSLFMFKRQFSKNTASFYIGKRIHNETVYEEIIQDWIKRNGEDAYAANKHLLQFYH